jgi:hypothetical protein
MEEFFFGLLLFEGKEKAHTTQVTKHFVARAAVTVFCGLV